jgi:sulfide:quinone oxidoreductase
MALQITKVSDDFSTVPQISVEDIAEIAQLGFKTIINNRPDHEGGDAQPTSAQLKKVAEDYHLTYVYIPVIPNNIQAEQIDAFNAAYVAAAKPVLGFCKTGNRAASIFKRSQAAITNQNKTYDIVIVGGGSAGVSVAASLLKRDRHLSIAIIEPANKHYYQPAWTLVGAGEFDIAKSERNMADCIPDGATWLQAAATIFEPENNIVQTNHLGAIQYQQLIVTAGLKLNWEAIKGLVETLGKNGVTSNYRFDLAPYTWQLVKNFKSGKALFTQPPLPIKCAGAPQKAMYLSCSHWEHEGVLKDIAVDFNNAGAVLFGVKEYVAPLMAYVKRYNANLSFNSTLVEVDGANKKAWFNVKDADGNITRTEKTFDILHVVPPQAAPDFIVQSPLANADGWVDVNQYTLQHTRYSNIFSLGDVSSTPNAKTMAAARKQVVVAVENLLALRAGRAMPSRYDGYGSCPLTVEKGKVILAEFGYGGKIVPTFNWDSTKPRKSAWLLKKYSLPWVYWHLMIKGREWLARCSACG